MFIPNAILGQIEIADGNGNTITRFGARGTNSANLEFRWATHVVASETACYVMDYQNDQLTKVCLDYVATASAEMQLPDNR